MVMTCNIWYFLIQVKCFVCKVIKGKKKRKFDPTVEIIE